MNLAAALLSALGLQFHRDLLDKNLAWCPDKQQFHGGTIEVQRVTIFVVLFFLHFNILQFDWQKSRLFRFGTGITIGQIVQWHATVGDLLAGESALWR